MVGSIISLMATGMDTMFLCGETCLVSLNQLLAGSGGSMASTIANMINLCLGSVQYGGW